MKPYSTLKGHSLWQKAWTQLLNHRAAQISLVLLLCVSVLVVIAPYLSHYSFDEIDWTAIGIPPSFKTGHYFGTDLLGRDLFVRTLLGGRTSLSVSIIAGVVSIVIGVTYGALSGFFGGRLDAIMMRIVDVLYALPFLFFVILLVAIFGRHLFLLYIGIAAVHWLDLARIVRGQTLALKHKEFIIAARAQGATPLRIIRRHIIPNVLGLVVVYMTLTIPQVVLTESFLSFLGLGVQEPNTSWGVLMSDGAKNMTIAWWTLVFPALFLGSTLLCLNYLGDGLRDALDSRDLYVRHHREET